MNSRFYYPTNSGSLGEPRRPGSFMVPATRPISERFGANDAPVPPTHLSNPKALVVEDDDNSLFAVGETNADERI